MLKILSLMRLVKYFILLMLALLIDVLSIIIQFTLLLFGVSVLLWITAILDIFQNLVYARFELNNHALIITPESAAPLELLSVQPTNQQNNGG